MTVRQSGAQSDSEQELADNILLQGDDLGDPKLAAAFARDSRASYDWLRTQGVRPSMSASGQPEAMKIPLGGHSLPRSVSHENGGLDYAHACWNALNDERIHYLEDAWFLDLYQIKNADCSGDKVPGSYKIQGGLIYHASAGEFISVRAQAVIIACGGLSSMFYPNTDTMKGNTGDSYAIAARAGAQLVDMEQIQFIPFAVASPPSHQGLIVGEPAIAGPLGVIRDKDGKVLKSEIMGRTRAECSAVIAQAVADGRGTVNDGCYLDLTENRRGKSGELFFQMLRTKATGLLKTVQGAMGGEAARLEKAWEVRPSAHYCMGGIQVTENAEAVNAAGQVIAGLYAVGQAMGGLHGSNRLGSTSLAEGLIFGRRAGFAASALVNTNQVEDWRRLNDEESRLLDCYSSVTQRDSGGNPPEPIHSTRQLQSACWRGLGPIRDRAGIRSAVNAINQVKRDLNWMSVGRDLLWNQRLIDYIECNNLCFCAEAVAHAALERRCSLGAHIRRDESAHPAALDRQIYSTVCAWDPVKKYVGVRRHERSASSPMARARLQFRQATKIAVVMVLRYLPFFLRDRILMIGYRRAL